MSPSVVGINLLWLVPGQVGGSEESTLASVRALIDLADPGLDLRLFVLDAFVPAHPDVAEAVPTEVLPIAGRSRPARVVAESSWLARRTRRLDLVHHAGGTAPPIRTAPYVLTVHDLQPLERKATHGSLKRAYLGAAVPRSVRHARVTIVPSEFVQRSVVERTGVDASRVVVVPHGVDVVEPATSPEVLRARYRLDGPVVLYPAITYPHKNHLVLLQAFAKVLLTRPDAVLVLTGGEGAEESRLLAAVDQLGLAESVRRTGRIPAADVGGLYREAAVVAVPSRYEGFGLPAVEAMAYGAPVVAAAATALPEVVGDAGILVDPDDVDGWADAIVGVLGSEERGQQLARAGLARAGRFTWEANGAALAAVYHRALAGHP